MNCVAQSLYNGPIISIREAIKNKNLVKVGTLYIRREKTINIEKVSKFWPVGTLTEF